MRLVVLALLVSLVVARLAAQSTTRPGGAGRTGPTGGWGQGAGGGGGTTGTGSYQGEPSLKGPLGRDSSSGSSSYTPRELTQEEIASVLDGLKEDRVLALPAVAKARPGR